MNWASLLSSTVVAATITAVVAIIGAVASSLTARHINAERVKVDRELAKQRAADELALAEKKIELDRKLALAKRRAEIAERVLSDFYRTKRAFEAVRSPMIWAQEMEPEEGVAKDVVENDGYGVIRRLRKYESLFADLEATRFTFGALFGSAATAPYDEVVRAHNRVVWGAQELLRYRHDRNLSHMQDFILQMRRDAFAMPDPSEEGAEPTDRVGAAIASAVAQIEATCRPALEVLA